MRMTALFVFPLAACASAQVPPVPPPMNPDALEIQRIILAGAEACARGDQAGVMRQYDRNVVLSFPGAPDRGYESLAAGFARLCRGSGDGTVERTVPTFEEIIVGRDHALVRVMWQTDLRGGQSRMLRDFQYWHRTPEGWRFRSGVHWPYSPEPGR